jgi:hypothetical protein
MMKELFFILLLGLLFMKPKLERVYVRSDRRDRD